LNEGPEEIVASSSGSEPAGKPLVEARRIGRRRPGAVEWLLNDVSVCIGCGQRIAVVGPTGAGKTLLLRSLALLDPLDEGSVEWNGSIVSPQSVPASRGRVIYLHQRPALPPESVEACLRQPFALGIHADKRFERPRIVDWLRAIGRDESFLEKSSRDLSGGERQITALIRAIQLDPFVLLLDEPTAALDAQSVEAAEHLVSRWLAERAWERAMVWVSHNPEQVRRVAERTIRIEAGRLIGQSS
jgi:putative ABC transport system ATP-binding protein